MERVRSIMSSSITPRWRFQLCYRPGALPAGAAGGGGEPRACRVEEAEQVGRGRNPESRPEGGCERREQEAAGGGVPLECREDGGRLEEDGERMMRERRAMSATAGKKESSRHEVRWNATETRDCVPLRRCCLAKRVPPHAESKGAGRHGTPR